MELAVPLPELGRSRLELAKARYLGGFGAEVVLEHAGVVKAALVPQLVDLAEGYCRQRGESTTVRKRLMQVVVEAVDNLCRHALAILGDSSFVLLVRDRDGFRLATGNAVPVATAALLAQRVEVLNAMPARDLKEQYLKILAFNGRSANGGAGLGLLTLARKSAPPLVLTTSPMGAFTSYLTIELRVVPEAGFADPDAA